MAVKLFPTRIITFIFLFILTTQPVLAQYDELKKNGDIPWIAEFTKDHSFSFSGVSDHQNIIKLIKFYNDPSNMDGAGDNNWLIHRVFQNAINGHYECYKDSKLTQRLLNKEINLSSVLVDTIITFYPETFEEVIEYKKVEIDPSYIKSFRTSQIIYYNQKTGNFDTKLIAIAPLLAIDSDKNLIPLFWIKMDTSVPETFNIKAPNITWGTLIDTKGAPLDINLFRVVKNEKNIDFGLFLQQKALNLEKPVENPKGYGCNKMLSKKQVGDMYNSIDTIITFDPNTFIETIEIAKHELDPKSVSNFRLVQEWYYDEKSKKMMNRLKAICPLYYFQSEKGVIEYVKDGSPRYAKPLYFIRYN